MITPEHALLNLAKHLGITYLLTVHSRGDGTYTREHHLFCDPDRAAELQGIQARFPDNEPVKVFETLPPPW